MKLYNAGSFFDPRAVPEADYDGVAVALAGLSRVIVESHPALVGPRVDDCSVRSIAHHPTAGRPALEVAMGLETAHPEALDRLNKRFTLERSRRPPRALDARGVALRVFLLISPPFVPPDEQDAWLLRSIDAAFDCGASVVSLVPDAPGNGAMEALAATGAFARAGARRHRAQLRAGASPRAGPRPRLRRPLGPRAVRRLPACFDARRERLHAMNLEQRVCRTPCAVRRDARMPQ